MNILNRLKKLETPGGDSTKERFADEWQAAN
jgi:uncharacterized protein YkuJ